MEQKTSKQQKTKALNIADVSNWAYFKRNKTAILLGFTIGTTLSIILNLIENIIVKIALIYHGG